MTKNSYRKFFTGIIAPSILAVVLFIVSFYSMIIPVFESNMMDRKKEMIRELTNTAISIINEHENHIEQKEISIEQAKKNAALQIEQMRYGNEGKDYFWIIDTTPLMIMHPYRKELNGKNLSEFTDSHEKKLFVDATKRVKEHGEGFIDYYWQWKDDTTRIVPKLSYVKGFPQWNWIIGTGIYLDDVKQEIAQLKNRLLLISAAIILIIIITLIYVIRQSLMIEQKRKNAEQKLLLSRQKYKNLVDASTEGTLMFVNQKVTFSNLRFADLMGIDTMHLNGMSFESIFTTPWKKVKKSFSDPQKTITLETTLRTKEAKEVVIAITKISHTGQNAYIVVAKNLSPRIKLEKSSQKLSEELQQSLLLMNQPVTPLIKKIISCPPETACHTAASIMEKQNSPVIVVRNQDKYIGVINDKDFRKRVVSQNLDLNTPVMEVMSAPLQSISENALLFEAVLSFKQNRVSHLLIKDNNGSYIGTISSQDALEMQRNALSYLLKEIDSSNNTDELKSIYQRVPTLINAVIVNSDNAKSMTRIISTIADTITNKVIDFAIEEQGKPPLPFAFMVLGSEGRTEQTLKTDQDNAIVIGNECSEKDKTYFLNLAKTINESLHYIGYNYCEGDIMASNPQWCLCIEKWKEQFTIWTKTPDPQNVLDSSIFFDLRCVYGEQELVQELKQLIQNKVKDNGLFFYHMSGAILRIKQSQDSQHINIKKLLLPFVSYFRLMALKYQITDTNTVERINALEQIEVISKDRHNELLYIYNFLMNLRLRQQASALTEHEKPENDVLIKSLSTLEQGNLKKATSSIEQMQKQLSLEIGE